MIEIGNTIVYRNENGSLNFYWLCTSRPEGYVFFPWLGDIRRATISDYWVMTKEWFESKVKDGTIEVYESLPVEEYGDVIEAMAAEKNR